MENRHFVLRGSEPDCWIEFEADAQVSDASYTITASFAGYRVAETSITLRGTQFLRDLRKLEQTRSGRAVLPGTYDFLLGVEAMGTTGDALVSFSITNLLSLPNGKYGRCSLEAAFTLPAEQLRHTLHAMERLLAHDDR